MARLLPPVLAFLAAPAFATDFIVLPGQSIQAAIDLASDGDRILVEPGVYVENIDFKGKAIEVIGVGGALVTTIDGNEAGPVVKMHLGEGPDSKLRGLTLANGDNQTFGTSGGGVSGFREAVPPACPTIEDCIIRDNTALFSGGGVAAHATIVRTSIYENGAVFDDGGGVYGAVTMRHCVVARNGARNGGGIAIHTGVATVEDCFIVENSGSQGGGVHVGTNGSGTMSRCVIVDNTSGGFGAAVAGVYVNPLTSSFIIDRSTIYRNTFQIGTGIGGVEGPAVVRNSIIRQNDAAQVSLGLPAVVYSNVEGGVFGTGNIDSPEKFVAPATPFRDFHIKSNSPSIDAGDPLEFDPDGTRVDMGAFPHALFYPRANALPDLWKDPAWLELGAAVGGKARLRMFLGSSQGGNAYLVLGSLTGTAPPTPFLGVGLPLAFDGFFTFTLGHANQPPYEDSFGFLDGGGVGNTTFSVPGSELVGLAGVKAWHAGVAIDSSFSATVATNAEVIEVVP